METTFPRDYFLYFNKDELTVEAFPTPQIWNDAPTIYEFHFLVTFAFQPNTPAKFLYNLTVPEVRTFPKTADYSIVIQTSESQELPDGYFISKTLNNIRKIINDNEGNITFYNFQRLSTDPFQYRIDWKICIVGEKCDSSFVKNITEKLLNNELQPSDDIVAAFSPDSIQNIETECENRPPTAMKNYTIVIKPCGHFIYQLPRSLAKDEEDGDLYSMSIQLKNKDGSSLDRTSWVQLNEETKSIIAIPTAKAYESLLQTPLNFLLLITDTEGKSIETILILTGEEKSSDSYYSTTITFQNNLGTNAPFVEIQIVILRNIASTNSSNSLDDYRLVDFKKLASDESSYQMIYSICKIDETVCVPEDNEIKTSEKQLQNDDGKPSTELINKLSPDILLKDIQFTKRYTIDEVPKTAEDSIKLAVDSCCHSRLYCLENDIFVDKEDGDIKNLKLSLMRRDTSPNSDFVGLVDDCIYVVSYQNFLPGIYNFVLEAQDKCNNTKPINIEVEVLKKCKDEFGVEFSVDIEKPAGEKIDQKDVYRIKSELEKYFSTEDNIAVISKEEQTSGKYTLNLGYCTLDINACDLKSVEEIISKLDENGESELTSILKIMNIELQDINIERKGDCTKPPFPPPESKLEKLEFNVTYCEHMDVKMAEDTFFNQEGLSTRDFQLQLLTVGGKDVGKDSWIQLNKTSQSIYGYIRFSDNQNQPKAFNFTLFVRKNEQDRGLKVPLCVYVIGEEPVLDYQMNIKSTILGDASMPNVYYEIEMTKFLASFFGRGSLNNLGLARSSSSLNEIESFKFSFCNARKKTM
uniref:Peptidase S72 domain-containing protein n=1 Tax=Clytia hemisphaerica TaxID=252671 RepID=A0A7M5X8K8_9CNID